MGIFFVLKQECPARQTGQALKYSIQSKIRTRPHRSLGEGKTNTESRSQSSIGIWPSDTLAEYTKHFLRKHRQQIPQRPEDE